MNHITSHLMGGIGNWMFQIAATYHYAKMSNNKKVLFDLKDVHVGHNPILHYQKNILRNIDFVEKTLDNQSNLDFESSPHTYHPIDISNQNIRLRGYFQNYKYIEPIENEIKQLFSITKEIESYLESKYPIIIGEKTCSLHVRRTDYLGNRLLKSQDLNYYKNAISRFEEDTMFLIFSDDIDWCKKNFDFLEKKIFVEGNQDYEDLYLMSLCKNNIIVNSSFSWWASILNKNEEKIIVSPKKWFNYPHDNHPDLCKNTILI